MNNQSHSLYWVLVLNTINVPAGERVYDLKAGEWYPSRQKSDYFCTTPIVIVSSDSRMAPANKDMGVRFPH
jgi:hypothetical protein